MTPQKHSFNYSLACTNTHTQTSESHEYKPFPGKNRFRVSSHDELFIKKTNVSERDYFNKLANHFKLDWPHAINILSLRIALIRTLGLLVIDNRPFSFIMKFMYMWGNNAYWTNVTSERTLITRCVRLAATLCFLAHLEAIFYGRSSRNRLTRGFAILNYVGFNGNGGYCKSF